jgi:hypothetical protein
MESDATRKEAAPATEWDNRQLCSDGNCIGVIGSDGRCKECGKPADPASVSELPSDPAPEPETPAGPAAQDPPPGEAPDGADDWSTRRLCSDGNCIGVIGPDGRCKECGRPFSG